MACLQDLQDDVAAILALMELPHSCCDAGDFTDGDQFTDRVTDGDGDVPQNIIDAGYASGVTDWAGFDDYKCMISHVIVDQIAARLLEIAPLLTGTGAVLGGVAALAGILAVIVSTAGLAIVFGIVAGIGATALLYQALTDFDLVEGLAAKVVTNHDALACAVYFSDGDVDALSRLNSKIDTLFTLPEALVLKNMNLGPTLKSLYAGRYDQQDIADILLDAGYDLGDFDCSGCDSIGEYLVYTDFETETMEGWAKHGGGLADGYGVDDSWAYIGSFAASQDIYIGTLGLFGIVEFDYEAGDKIILHRLIYWQKGDCGEGSNYVRFSVLHDEQTDSYDNVIALDHVEHSYTFDPPLEFTHDIPSMIIIKAQIGTGCNMMIDNITLDFDIEPV